MRTVASQPAKVMDETVKTGTWASDSSLIRVKFEMTRFR
jgi:hypothetical protein